MQAPTSDSSAAAQPVAAAVDGKEAVPVPAAVPGGFAHWRAALAIVGSTLVVDHLVKWLAIAHLKDRASVTVIPGLFQLTYAENLGAAFSFLHGHVEFLALVSLAVSALMTYWWTRLPKDEIAGRTAFALVVGGAVGNLIDRAFRGYVVDMFDAYVGTHHWPVFNIADSCICIGMGILVLRMWKGKI